MAVFKRLNIEWVPVLIEYNTYIYGEGKDLRFYKVPKVFQEDEWPIIPTPTRLGFDAKPLPATKETTTTGDDM